MRDATATATARNVRSLLFRLSRSAARDAFCRPQSAQVLQALKNHGFRLGFVGEEWSEESEQLVASSFLASAFDFVHFSREADDAVFARAAQALDVSLRRTMLVTDASMASTAKSRAGFAGYQELAHVAASDAIDGRNNSRAHPLSTFAQDLLGFANCFDTSSRCFGPFRVLRSQIFYESALSFALVNLKPIVPGHVLIVPKRRVDRFEHLDADEVADLWCTAQLVGKNIETHFQASSLTFAIQDGASAGQTVKHVHIHVLPRVDADFAKNDDVYTKIEAHERSLKMDNEPRAARSENDMAREAALLRALFPDYLSSTAEVDC